MDTHSEVSVLIVSKSTLLRESAQSFFERLHYSVRRGVSKIDDAISQVEQDVDLIFVDQFLDEAAVDSLRLLRSSFSRSRIVVYTPAVQVAAERLTEVFGGMVDGCLLSDSTMEVIQQSLSLVMTGGQIFPFPVLVSIFSANRHSPGKEQEEEPRGFSEREREVLRFLREGRSNKSIARELRVSEATVKVHIKTLLRKIGCSNRTQAAIWVTRNEAPGTVPSAEASLSPNTSPDRSDEASARSGAPTGADPHKPDS